MRSPAKTNDIFQTCGCSRSSSGARWQLHDLKGKEQYPLAEWSEAVSYLLGCTVHFESYGQITASLKPFAKGMH